MQTKNMAYWHAKNKNTVNKLSPAKQGQLAMIDKGLNTVQSIKGSVDELTGKAHLNRAMNQPITPQASGGLSKKEEQGQ
jgi:hypothetical protein